MEIGIGKVTRGLNNPINKLTMDMNPQIIPRVLIVTVSSKGLRKEGLDKDGPVDVRSFTVMTTETTIQLLGPFRILEKKVLQERQKGVTRMRSGSVTRKMDKESRPEIRH